MVKIYIDRVRAIKTSYIIYLENTVFYIASDTGILSSAKHTCQLGLLQLEEYDEETDSDRIITALSTG